MLGLDYRVVRYTWSAAFTLLLLSVIYLIRETLFIFAVALLFAYLLWPLVNFFDRRLPGRSRVPALAIVYLLLVGSLVVIGIETGSRVMVEADALGTRVPELISKLEPPPVPPQSLPIPTVRDRLIAILRNQIAEHSRELLPLLPNAALSVLDHARNLIFIVLVPILSFFFMKDGREITKEMLGLFAEGPRRDIFEIATDLHLLLAQYVRALVFLALAAFAAYGLFLSLIGVPYAILLAAIAFLLEFIPMVGPLAAAVVVLTVAGLSGFHHLLWILVFLIAFRLFQDYVLSPHLMSAGVKLHPLVVIFGVFAGAGIAGIPGIFLSVPILAALRIVYRRLHKKSVDSGHPAAETVINKIMPLKI